MLNHYVTLGVGPAADDGEIKSAYRKAARDASVESRVLATTTYADWP